MSTQALTIAQKRQIAVTQQDAWRQANIVQQTLAARFQKRNKDGSLWTPRLLRPVAWPMTYTLIEIDPQSLYHFDIPSLRHPNVESLLTANVGARVVSLDMLPPMTRDGVARHGLWYVIVHPYLERISARVTHRAALPTSLPRVSFNAATIPDGCLMVPIGKTSDGELWEPLTKLLHVMVIGESGSGKSNWLKVAVLALMQKASPPELQLAIISPKRAEFSEFANAPHIWKQHKNSRYEWDGRIAANAEEADRMILALREEFDRRDRLFVTAGATNLEDYNKIISFKLPRILVVADEVLDLTLMAERGSKMKEHMASLVSVGRSHGFHLFLGSTKPRFDVLPSLLTDNIDNRICFRVATLSAARMVNCPGANEIPYDNKGRAVARVDGKLFHVQAFLVTSAGIAATSEVGAEKTKSDQVELGRNTLRLVRWAVNHPGEFRGGMQQDLLTDAFDKSSPNDGGERITAWSIRRELSELKVNGLLARRVGAGTTYYMTDELVEAARI